MDWLMRCNIHWITKFNTLELSCPDSSPRCPPWVIGKNAGRTHFDYVLDGDCCVQSFAPLEERNVHGDIIL